MDYTESNRLFQIKKVFRYLKLYGPSRTMAKVKGQLHMNRLTVRGSLTRDDIVPGVGIIGCGNYSYNVIGYYLKRKGKVVRATMDININRAESLAKYLKANYFTNDFQKILVDDKIKLVFIASNHQSHAEYAIDLIKAGKHVHIEKPHVVNPNQLTRLIKSMNESDSKVRLGFNRPSSKFGEIILKKMADQPGASMINWFIAGHEIDPNHWYFHEKEGGRVLGNLCHWTDFCYHQLGGLKAFPIAIHPVVANKTDCDISVSMVSVDGSIATITFSAKGHTFEGVREKLNVHKGNLLLSMSDYEILRVDIIDKKRIFRNIFRDHGHQRNILRSYEMLNEERGEEISYIEASAKLFLGVKKALELNKVLVVDKQFE